MGFLEDMQETLDRGVSSARGAVSGVAVEQLGFVKAFARMCQEGWLQGWHEANGGNLSYRLTDADVAASRAFFYDTPGSWVSMGAQIECLAGAHFLVTRAGGHFRTVQAEPGRGCGIVEVDAAGAAWRVVWGLKDGGLPTRELPSHLMAHAMRMAATDGAARVVYHAHMPNLAALTLVVPAESRVITRLLWKVTTECVMAAPTGVGVLDTNTALKQAISDALDAITSNGAAGIYLAARAANGGAEPQGLLSDETLQAVIEGCKVPANGAYR